ncbi:MAG TPA: hypothetical protein VMQ44_03400 [Candidatus Saccharimonadales bacterium]|nr:hypothetical protein [Candidatus Saccharimonadales bacterium]
MLVFLSGSDPFLAKRAIDEIKAKYLQKNSGAELIEINGDQPITGNFADLQAVPLFATTRLVIIKQVGQMAKNDQENLASFLGNLPETTVAVVWDGKLLPAGSKLGEVLAAAKKIIPVAPLEGVTLKNFIKKQAGELGTELTSELADNLLAAFGNDLWALSSELHRLSLGGTLEEAKKDLEEKFIYFRLIRSRNWSAIGKELRRDLDRGVPIELTMGMLFAAVRKELSDEERKSITELMADLDYGLKTGLLDDAAVTALLVAHLPKPAAKRVVWERAWQWEVS